jgi:hypothetical protein
LLCAEGGRLSTVSRKALIKGELEFLAAHLPKILSPMRRSYSLRLCPRVSMLQVRTTCMRGANRISAYDSRSRIHRTHRLPGRVRIRKFNLECDLTYGCFSWNAVAPTVISTVRAQVAAQPGYQLVSTGHSLGGALFIFLRFYQSHARPGALSSLAGISLQQNFPGNTVRMYTYGTAVFTIQYFQSD